LAASMLAHSRPTSSGMNCAPSRMSK
jgi:hypothetical protein